MILTTKWHGRVSFASSAIPVLKARTKFGLIKVADATQSESNTKRANLSAAKKERVQLPNYGNKCGSGSERFHIGEFLSHPSAIEALLNTNALKSFQCVGTNTYRCTLQRVQLLSFEAGPVLDLRVTPTNKDCTVEMLSCKFEGSEIMEQQNSHFSAFMRNHMTWDTTDSESFLEVDVMLNLTLEESTFCCHLFPQEIVSCCTLNGNMVSQIYPNHCHLQIYTRPFTMMPVSAVERPGNLMLHALLDRLVPLLLQQLLEDYGKWVRQQKLDPVP